jgi:hypothetical protein
VVCILDGVCAAPYASKHNVEGNVRKRKTSSSRPTRGKLGAFFKENPDSRWPTIREAWGFFEAIDF